MAQQPITTTSGAATHVGGERGSVSAAASGEMPGDSPIGKGIGDKLADQHENIKGGADLTAKPSDLTAIGGAAALAATQVAKPITPVAGTMPAKMPELGHVPGASAVGIDGAPPKTTPAYGQTPDPANVMPKAAATIGSSERSQSGSVAVLGLVEIAKGAKAPVKTPTPKKTIESLAGRTRSKGTEKTVIELGKEEKQQSQRVVE